VRVVHLPVYDGGTMGQRNLGRIAGLLGALLCAASCWAGAQGDPDSAKRAPVIAPANVDGLGRGTFALDGQWEFHTGDDMAWAAPGFDDSNWEQIDISRPWGDQGHWAYAGYAWYRRQIEFKTEPGAAAEVSLFVPDALCAYEVYWNGRLIGRTGRPFPLPPEVDVIPPAVFRQGVAERGVLAFRALTRVNDTTINGDEVGLVNVPRLGNGEAISSLAAQVRAKSLKKESLDIAEMVIYAQLFLLGAVVWARNRERKLLFWMAVFFLSAALWVGLKNPAIFPGLASSQAASGDEFHTLEDVALWFLLLYLLELDRYPRLMRLTRVLAVVSLACATLDFAFLVYGWSPSQIRTEQLLDALVTVGFALPQIYPLVLIPFAFRQRRDPARRFVAVAAFLSDMYFVVWHTAIQGRRFTHWTLGDTISPIINCFELGSKNLDISPIEDQHPRTTLCHSYGDPNELQHLVLSTASSRVFRLPAAGHHSICGLSDPDRDCSRTNHSNARPQGPYL
jgi:diguanylate cyclase